MLFSGMILAFIKGWSLTLPMLLIGPIMLLGLACLISGVTKRYTKQAVAYG